MAVCCALLAGGCTARRAEQHRKTGDTYVQLGKLKEAAQEYDSALALDSKNVRAQYGRGAVLARQRKAPEALAEFEKALKLDPKFEPAYVESMRLLLAEKKYPEAEALAKRLQGAIPEAGDLMLAGVYLETNRAADAVSLLENRQKASPNSNGVKIALAKAYLAANQADKSEAALQAMVDAGGEGAFPARMALVEVYRAQGKLDKTLEELKSLIEERPADAELKLVMARALLENGRIKEAYDAAEPVLQQAPDNPWANYIIGSCLVAQKQFEDAIPYLETAARGLPQQAGLERELAMARAAGKAPAEAVASAETPATPVASTAPATEAVPATDAPWQTLWQQGRLGSLVENREKFLKQNPDDVLMKETITLGALFAGRADVAQEVAQKLPAESPAAAYIKALSGANSQAASQNALQMARKAMTPWQKEVGDRKILERNAVGALLARAGLRGQAMLAFAEAGKISADNVVFLENLARMYRAAQMPDFAAGALQKLLSRYPNNIETRQLLFQVYLENNKLKEAKDVAENMYGLFPEERESVLSLAQIYTLLGQTDLASDVLTRGMEKRPDDKGYALALASVRLAEGKAAEAQQLVEKVGDSGPVTDRVRRNVLAFAQAAQGNWSGAADTAIGTEALSGSPALRLLHAVALVSQGNIADASKDVLRTDGTVSGEPKMQVFAKALGVNVEGLSAKQSDLASRLAAQPKALADYGYGLACVGAGLPLAAYDAYERAAQQVGEHPYLLLGRMDALAKMPESSDRVAKAKALAEKHGDSAEAWIGLAAILQESKDAAGAKEALNKASSLAPDDPLVWVQRCEFADEQKDLPMALEACQKLTALMPDNPSFHNNYAYYLLETNGDPALALKEAQAAYEKLKTSPNVLHTLGLAELRNGDTQKAYDNLRSAVEKRPGDPTLLLDFGQVLIKMNQPDEGRRHVAMALQCADMLQLDFPRRAEAEQLVPKAAPATTTTAAVGG
jgi:predicted Zn-dependent protease